LPPSNFLHLLSSLNLVQQVGSMDSYKAPHYITMTHQPWPI